MLAVVSDADRAPDLQDGACVYEPKYDGIRALVALEPGQPTPLVRIWSRLGNDKTAQFPDVVKGLRDFAKRLRMPVLLDGEIVALDERGEPAGFQRLQGRMHLTGVRDIEMQARTQGAAIVLFDMLRDGADDLRSLPLTDRRSHLERLFGASGSSLVRLGESAAGDGRRLYAQAMAEGWEGLLSKRADSIYDSGRRSGAWRKVKLQQQQELVVGGWTEPRQTRQHFGALLLGVYPDAPETPATPVTARRGAAATRARADEKPSRASADPLTYVGHVGTGFTGPELARVHALLRARAIDASPFTTRPASNERPHWVRPDLVVQVRFSHVTNEGMLRHPVYLGIRDDVPARSITMSSLVPASHGPRGAADEDDAAAPAPGSAQRSAPATTARSAALAVRSTGGRETTVKARAALRTSDARTKREATPATTSARDSTVSPSKASSAKGRGAAASRRPSTRVKVEASMRKVLDAIVQTLHALEESRRDGVIELPGGAALEVTNLWKVFWPTEGLTKGDLLRYYTRVSPWLLPVVQDRPLIMKRFPNGVKGKAFYQQRAPDDVPPGVRVDLVEDEGEEEGYLPRLIGGELVTLLYTTQLAAISQDPWFSRVQSRGDVDYVALDLDPMPGVSFAEVLDVARWIHDELEALGVPGVAKTSGASGLHVYIPMPPDTSYEAGQLFCNIIATMVAMKHARMATVERQVAKRGRKVYVDYLQNIEGKSLATAYSARASEFAGVSTPLTWQEVHDGVDPTDFTMKNAMDRFEAVGDLWAELRGRTVLDLRHVLERLAASG